MKIILALIVLTTICYSQQCFNHRRQGVDWFVILTTPRTPAQGKPGYHYFDSKSLEFSYHYGTADSQGHPIYNTIQQLNHQNFSTIMWNDQVPKVQKFKTLKLSSKQFTAVQKAHAKTVIGYNLEAQTGIVIAHSVPYYPSLIGEGQINPTIHEDQTKYGQHLFCFNSGNNTKQILTKASITFPKIYFNSNNDEFIMKSQNLFQYSNFNAGKNENNKMKIIYKNGLYNSSILHDGLTQMLQSSLVAQTWDRSSTTPWCDTPFMVEIAKQLNFKRQNLTWTQGQDHSKWVVPTDQNNHFACFGDMNVMKSQYRRGGAFYCIHNQRLKTAMISIIQKAYMCPGSQSPFQPWIPPPKNIKTQLFHKPKPKNKNKKNNSVPKLTQKDKKIKTIKTIKLKNGRSIKISLELLIQL